MSAGDAFDALISRLETPAYVLDLARLRACGDRLQSIQRGSGASVLLALKGFATWSAFPALRHGLTGAAVSSPHEARLAREHLGGELHAYFVAYGERDLEAVAPLCSHLTFNSEIQLKAWARRALTLRRDLSIGLRVDPECSVVKAAIYDASAPGSRFGVTMETARELIDGELVRGILLHNHGRSFVSDLEKTLEQVEAQLGDRLDRLEWLNLGGGHWVNHPQYEVDRLIELLARLTERYRVRAYVEPGEGAATDAGVLVGRVLDLFQKRETTIAILDLSAYNHMPCVIHMPLRPRVLGGDQPGKKPFTYRLGGITCVSGDVMGDYSFDRPLAIGDAVVFEDMAHYTTVMATDFNGVRRPSIYLWDSATDQLQKVRSPTYEDCAGRLS